VLISARLSVPPEAPFFSLGREEEARTLVFHDAPPSWEVVQRYGDGYTDMALEPDAREAGWMHRVLAALRRHHSVHSVLVEGGGRLLGSMLAAGLINEAHIYTGPRIVADPSARGVDAGAPVERLAEVSAWRLLSVRSAGDDVQSVYRPGR
jgi:riboflavin biosynthesis pyrimidine reductase